jgi:hypothetical protein
LVNNGTTGNSRLAQWLVLFKPVVDFPLENLILVENMHFRTSQLREAAERQWQPNDF